MTKSALLAAYYPSKPAIPTPTLAEVIMLTSLAPSPIARVVLSGYCFLIICTMSAFYLGDTLQASTTDDFAATFRNSSYNLLFISILVRESPPRIIALLVIYSVVKDISLYASTSCWNTVAESDAVTSN